MDERIIRLLSGDSRLPYRKIAKMPSVSYLNVSNRVKRLEEGGVIPGYKVGVEPPNASTFFF